MLKLMDRFTMSHTKIDSQGMLERAQLMPKLLDPAIADAFLRSLWRDIVSQPQLTQTHQDRVLKKNALEIHGRNHKPMLALHWGLTSIITERMQTDLLPSFCFFRIYFGGDVCRVHSDRSACEVSASLTLGYSDGHPWPLCIATSPAADRLAIDDDFGAEEYETFLMNAGDAVLYQGSIYRHGRPTPNPNRWSAHLFLQWVRRGGPHEDEAFERLELEDRPPF